MPGESDPRTAGIEDTLALGSASTAAPESEATRRIGSPPFFRSLIWASTRLRCSGHMRAER